ncbi:TRAP transporter small permease subunit [Shewanella nanhaiensis]|uniref:TRAP transporter small permease protein n=1 Tax=Shewanella nanhaiensis TaxID=2864872 RepID=A0ABS7E5R9_9GAMM|nr:TRAP transporter small permease subunit [Shewanella nanhaiensis]MBW8185024.1 TRAP transporter small permease subunit [Shewanella nanhaiensis]
MHTDEPESVLTKLPHTKLSAWIESVIIKINEYIFWLWPILMVVIVLNVLMRYFLGEGRVEFEELQWHLYAIGWVIGLSYCVVKNEHVRVDVFYERFSIKTRCWVELLGMVFLLLPFLILVIIYAIPFVLYSWELSEVSTAPGGLPYRWFIKSILLFGFVLLGLSVIAKLSQVINYLITGGRSTAEKEGKNGS